MYCKNCGVVVDVDSRFCKDCGCNLQPALLKTPTDDTLLIGEFIYTAHTHKEEGRLDEAVAACQGALALNPANVSVHVLLGSIFERKADIESAVYEYEKALELDPDNADARERFRNLSLEPEAAPALISVLAEKLGPYRAYMPHALAVVTLFLVLLVGATLTRGAKHEDSRPAASASTPAVDLSTQPASGYGQSYGVPTGPANAQPATQESAASPQLPAEKPTQIQPQPAATPVGAPRVQTPAVQRPQQAQQPKPAQQPAPQNRASLPPMRVLPAPAPVKPIDHESPVITPVIEPADSSPGGQLAVITPADQAAIAPVDRPSGSVSITHTQVDPEERARRLQAQGKYKDAITGYRDAIFRTSDKGRVYQQMGICYQRTGQHDKAVESYSRAIESFKEQAAAGRDQNEVKMNIKACEAGLKVSQSLGQ